MPHLVSAVNFVVLSVNLIPVPLSRTCLFMLLPHLLTLTTLTMQHSRRPFTVSLISCVWRWKPSLTCWCVAVAFCELFSKWCRWMYVLYLHSRSRGNVYAELIWEFNAAFLSHPVYCKYVRASQNTFMIWCSRVVNSRKKLHIHFTT